MTLTKEQREIIEHCLFGSSVRHSRRREPYRNFFAACPDNLPDGLILASLVGKGLMLRRRNSPSWTGGLVYYHVTAAGMRAVGVDPDAVGNRTFVPADPAPEPRR